MNGKATAFAMSLTQAVIALRPSDVQAAPSLQIVSTTGSVCVLGADAMKALRLAINYALGEEPQNE